MTSRTEGLEKLNLILWYKLCKCLYRGIILGILVVSVEVCYEAVVFNFY